MTPNKLYPPEVLVAAETALDNLLCNCKESCGSYEALRQASINDIAEAIMAERHRWFEAIDRHKDRIEVLQKALTKAADQLALVHHDAFRQAGGYGLATSDGRDFSCFQLNMCESASHEARAVLQEASNG